MYKRIVTPICHGGVIPTLVAKYEGRVYSNGLLDTKHYPGAGVIEIWKSGKSVTYGSADE